MKHNLQSLKDWTLCFSLANLLFLFAWQDLLIVARSERIYFRHYPTKPIEILALLLNVALLAIVFRFLKFLVVRINRPPVFIAASFGLICLLMIPVNFIRIKLKLSLSSLDMHTVRPLVWLVSAATVVCLTRWYRPVSRAAMVMLMAVSPLVLITFTQAVWSLFTNPPGGEVTRLSSVTSATNKFTEARLPHSRAVWLVFDELDQRSAFSNRAAMLEMPEFDRFRSHAFFAENAYPPARDTKQSLPSLITGRTVRMGVPVAPDELLLTLDESSVRVAWSQLPNIFSEASRLKLQTAVVGWYHPYSRVLGAYLTTSECRSYCGYDPGFGTNLFDVMLHQVSENLPRFSLPRLHLRDYLSLMGAAERVVANPALGMVLCHLPVPHLPGIYDRSTKRFAFNYADETESYLGNLVLADQTLGALRRAMERARVWDSTTVIVTSDHWWRRESPLEDRRRDHRVPFIVKLAGCSEPVVYPHRFNTVLIESLTLAILGGEVSRSEELTSWLDRHRHAPIPTAVFDPSESSD